MANYVQLIAGVGAYPNMTPLLRAEVEQVLTVTAVTNTDVFVPMPIGARDVEFCTITDTAFTAVTDAQISIGKTAGGAEYVAAVSIKAIGKVSHTNVNAQAADYQSLPQAGVYVRIAQSGGSTAVGSAKLYIRYAMPG